MYIVSKDREQVINSDHVIKFYIDITEYVICGDPDFYKTAFLVADTLNDDLLFVKTRTLGQYNSAETAQEILKLLLDALQDDTGTFYMPQS